MDKSNKPITAMDFSDIKYEKENNTFRNNLDADYACFVIWKSARPYLDKIRGLLASQFEILLETEVVWTEENIKNNSSRLYKLPISDVPTIAERRISTGYIKKIGQPNFILFIVKDTRPNYNYSMTRSGSKNIMLSNLNIVKAKYQIRDWVYEDLGVSFTIHSTENATEFFQQVPLILGVDLFNRILNGEKLKIKRLAKDLEGANGWKSWHEVFEILNVTNNYLVLRGFETSPEPNTKRTVEVLTDNFQVFASTLCAKQMTKKPYKCEIRVADEIVNLNIRFIGDKYYNTIWANDMLNTKINRQGVYTPRKDHYFFSLLFHARVQNPEVKSKYNKILDKIAEEMNFAWYNLDNLKDDKAIGGMINGYFRAHKYYYQNPLDKEVYKNVPIVKRLQTRENLLPENNWKKEIKIALKRKIPKNMTLLLKGMKRSI